MPHIFEKEKIAKLEAQNQGLGITRGGVGSRSRVVSAPQPSRNVSLASRHPNLQSDILGRFDKFEPAPLRIRPKSVVKRQVPVDRAGDGSRNSRHLNQLPVVKDESTGFDPELILPSARADGRQSLRLVNGETRAIAVKVNPVMSGALATVVVDPPTKEVKKKRSFFDVLKGKNKIAPEPKDPVIEEVVAGETKGTFGRRSGNLLKRWASRDAGGLLAFGSSDDRGDTQSIANGLTSCFMTPQDSKEGSDCFGGSEEDQFTKVMSQRNWFMKFLNVKPASRVICFTISPVATRKEIMKLWKEWVKYGLVIVEDDRKSLVVRARVKTPNSLNIKEVSFVGEIRAYGGSRKTGSGVVRFTQERGAASSFNRVIEEMAKKFSEKGIILPED
ncbi:hypothetical protein L873DRAFT_1827098 [Choiromyces venosus 120613-1]|uniref:non-specific serine/threonine protein kinase n=1 Tax=Choiromyces venosus 120613-1 TaxID=1336337 RepID=A0A3N4JU13_9PEZI|nr:hypothetical protein L873DRAFT_1827098 [Choiromyces venosus 120613-1]